MSSSDSDSDEDLMALSRFAKVSLNKPTKPVVVAPKKIEKSQEELLEERNLKKKQEKGSKADKRLAFSLNAVKVADSHKESPNVEKVEEEKEVLIIDPNNLKGALKQGYEFHQYQNYNKAIEVLKPLYETAVENKDDKVALSTCALLAKCYLELELTRDAIIFYNKAIGYANQLKVSEGQRQTLIKELQQAYLNVGDNQSAIDIGLLYGGGDCKGGLPDALRNSLENCLEDAIMKKDLEPAKLFVSSFIHGHYSKEIVSYCHSQTGTTLLHVACGRNNLELVQTLLTAGAPVDVKDALGLTPLLWATRFGGIDVLDELFKNGARFDENLSKEEIEKWPKSTKEKLGSVVSM